MGGQYDDCGQSAKHRCFTNHSISGSSKLPIALFYLRLKPSYSKYFVHQKSKFNNLKEPDGSFFTIKLIYQISIL